MLRENWGLYKCKDCFIIIFHMYVHGNKNKMSVVEIWIKDLIRQFGKEANQIPNMWKSGQLHESGDKPKAI